MGFMEDLWAISGSIMAAIMFVYAMSEQFLPPYLLAYLRKYTHKLTCFVSPYIQISFHEFGGEKLKRSDAFTTIQTYLIANSSHRVRRLKAEFVKDSQTPFVLSMDDNEEITEEFQVVKVSKNYLGVESHELFPKIEELLGETNMTPADVGENLMPKSIDEEDLQSCLQNLINALELATEEAKKTEEEKEEYAQQEVKANGKSGMLSKRMGSTVE